MTHNYSYKEYNNDGMARAVALALPVSTKQSIEICSFIRNTPLDKAKEELKKIIEEKRALPLRRFTGGAGHQKKIGPGSYPKKASKEIVKLLETVEANAQFKGLSTANLIIKHISANRASKSWHYGRIRGRQMKRTNVEVVVEERKQKKETKK